MTDAVAIANVALSMLGAEDGLNSIDDDKHTARSIRAVWAPVRRALLREHPWNFAVKRARLAARGDGDPPVAFAHAFPLPAAPSECLRLLDVGEPRFASYAYQVEGREILADTAGPLTIRYIADIEEPTLWDELFVEGFSARLAQAVADRITGDLERAREAERRFDKALRRARMVDTLENPPVAQEESDWVLARYR